MVTAMAKRATDRLNRTRAIVAATVRLAEQGGLEAVRLRDVARDAGVSMGALYRCFDSKEDILLYALSEDFTELERACAANPIEGSTAVERVEAFFRLATKGLVARPSYARATITATASGQSKAVRQVATLNARMERLIRTAIAGEPTNVVTDIDALARVLHRVWFATLVGWAAGVHDSKALVSEMRTTAALLMRGDE